MLRGHCERDAAATTTTIEKTVMFRLDPGEKGEKVGRAARPSSSGSRRSASARRTGWVPRVREIEPLEILGREVVPAAAEI